ncbi:MAG: heme-binding protein [Nocardioides sp.]
MVAQRLVLTESDVTALITTVVDEARSEGIAVVVAVVDDGGTLLGLHRMDGAKLPAVKAAPGKAWTSAMFRRASGDYQDLVAPGGGSYALWNAFPGQMVPVLGGQPILWGDDCLGAVGVSGGTGQQDDDLASLAVRSLLVNEPPEP